MNVAKVARVVPLRIGRYTVHDAIANGGTARLHVGRLSGDAGFARTVAVKRLHPQLIAEPELVKMLLDEARLAARIHHVNVVQTLDVVVQEDEVFIVMEYVRGETLSRVWKRLRERGQRIPLEIACAIAVNMLRGLHAAHEARDELGRPLSIVHRDVSPQNILVGGDGVARVIDFGVAKATVRLQTTRDGTLKGKLAYMAPEQLTGGASRSSDIFSAAVVLWECLTGVRLFYEDSETRVIERIMAQRVPPPTEIVPTLPRALDAVVLSALSRVKSARFPTAEDMGAAIERIVPIAPPAVVARWLTEVAGDMMMGRDAIVAEIERTANDAPLQEAERISAIVLKRATPHEEIPIVTASEPEIAPATERCPAWFHAAQQARREHTGPSDRRVRSRATAVYAALAGSAMFVGAVVFVGGLALSSRAASAAEAPPVRTPSVLVAPARLEVQGPPTATVAVLTDTSAPVAAAPPPPRRRPAPPAPQTDEAGF